MIFIIICLFIYLVSSSTEQEINSKNDQIIELNAAVYTLSSGSGTFNYYVDSFNEYSKNNNLNITIKLEMMTELNSDFSLNNENDRTQYLLNKKHSKYDIFFFDNMYTSQNAPYLLKLDQYLPKEHIDMYNKHILSQIGYHEGHLVALVKKKF